MQENTGIFLSGKLFLNKISPFKQINIYLNFPERLLTISYKHDATWSYYQFKFLH